MLRQSFLGFRRYYRCASRGSTRGARPDRLWQLQKDVDMAIISATSNRKDVAELVLDNAEYSFEDIVFVVRDLRKDMTVSILDKIPTKTNSTLRIKWSNK
jgi:hypothetical protein